MIEGFMEQLQFAPPKGLMLFGWAADKDHPSRPLTIEVLQDDTVVATAVADKFRQDLRDAGIGEGHHGFEAALPDGALKATDSVSLSLRVAGAVALLAGPEALTFDPVAGVLESVEGMVVTGWACNGADPRTPLVLDILLDGQLVDRVIADQYRDDLASFHGGRFHFQWIFPEAHADGRRLEVAVRVANRDKILHGRRTVVIDRDRFTVEQRRQLALRQVALRQARSCEHSLYDEGRRLLDRAPVTPTRQMLRGWRRQSGETLNSIEVESPPVGA